jgi:hypothetical protein
MFSEAGFTKVQAEARGRMMVVYLMGEATLVPNAMGKRREFLKLQHGILTAPEQWIGARSPVHGGFLRPRMAHYVAVAMRNGWRSSKQAMLKAGDGHVKPPRGTAAEEKGMKCRVQMALGGLLVLGSAAALACTIENAREEGLPGGKRISGTCSNNGSPVTCTYRNGEGWTCQGPGGTHTSLANPEVPLGSACECDTTPKW